jgi:WD40 repeat protein
MLAAALLASHLAAAAPAFGPSKPYQGPNVLAMAASPTGHLVAVSFEDNTVRIIDAATRATVRTLTGHPQPVYAVAWSNDGAAIATGDESARIFVWNAKTGKQVKQFRTHTKGIEALSFNNDHSLLLSTGRDDVVKLYSLRVGKEVKSIPSGGLNFYGAHFEPDGKRFSVGMLTKEARCYRVDGSVFCTFHDFTGQGILDLDYSHSSKEVVTGGKDGKAIIWDAVSGKKTGTLQGHEDWVVHAVFSPSDLYVATSGNDRTVRLWNTKTLKEVAKLDNQSSVGAPLAFTADGQYLVSSSVSDELLVTPLNPAIAGVTASKPAKQTHRRRHRRA